MVTRSRTDLGSSKYWATRMSAGFFGPLSSNASLNPDMHDWTRVFVGYGDGGSFSGDAARPLIYNGTKLYFRGAHILPGNPPSPPSYFPPAVNMDSSLSQNVCSLKDSPPPVLFAHMVKHHGLGSAKKIVLAGNSAGGLAVYLNIDRVAAMMAPIPVLGIAVSGWFMDSPNLLGVSVFASEMQQLLSLQNLTLSPECTRQYGADSYRCILPRYSFQFIKTPVFVQNSAYDSYQIAYIWTKGTPLWPAWLNCTTHPNLDQPDVNQCSPAQVAMMNQKWRPPFVKDVLDRAPVAYLEPILSHSGAIFPFGWSDSFVDGWSVRQAWSSWIRGKISKRHWTGCKLHSRRPYQC